MLNAVLVLLSQPSCHAEAERNSDPVMDGKIQILSGGGDVTCQTAGHQGPEGDDVSNIALKTKASGLEVWFKESIPLPPDIQNIEWRAYSRGLMAHQTQVVLESPQGDLQAYRTATIGDSPWTPYRLRMDSRGAPLRQLPSVKASGGWRYRGLIFRYPPYVSGNVLISDVKLTRVSNQIEETYIWSLRDLDESLSKQLSYAGFRIQASGETLPASVDFNLLKAPARNASKITWQIRGKDDLILAEGEQSEGVAQILPALPEGAYWVRYKLFDTAGTLASHYEASYLVRQSKTTNLPEAPVQKAFDIFWPDKSVVALEGKPPSESLGVPLKGALPGDVVSWNWRDGASNSLQQGRAKVENSDSISIPSAPTDVSVGQRIELDLELIRSGSVIDARVAYFYPGSDQRAVFAQVPKLHGQFKFYQTDVRNVLPDQVSLGGEFLKMNAAIGSLPFLCFFWDDLEPREGFRQFRFLDERLKQAAESKTPVVLTLLKDQDRLPRWLWYNVMSDQNGQSRQHVASYLRKWSPTDARIKAALYETIRAVIDRYKDASVVEGWNFSQGVESFWSDAARNGFVVDYSPTTGAAFGEFLQKKGWSLEETAKALGKPLAAWSDVVPPQPIFNDSLDLRRIWLAWQEFKQTYPSRFFDEMLSVIRKEDPIRPIYQYGTMGVGDTTYQLDTFKRHQAALCFGGSEGMISPFFESICRQGKVALEAEASAVPPYEPMIRMCLFNKLSHGSLQGGYNSMWGRMFRPDGADFIAAAKNTSQIATTLGHLVDSEPVHAPVAISTGVQSIINRTRSFMWPDWMATARQSFGFSEMISQTVRNSAQVGYVTDKTPAEELVRWPAIVLLEAPLLDDAGANRFFEYVRNGGKLMLMGETGRYNQEGRETWTLRTLLGIAADGKIHTLGKGLVQWLPSPISWSASQDACSDFGSWIGFQRPLKSDIAQVRVALRRSLDGRKYWGILLNQTWAGGNPRLDDVPGKPVTIQLSSTAFPDGTTWKAKDLADNQTIGTFSSQVLAKGVPLSIHPAELRIIEFEKL